MLETMILSYLLIWELVALGPGKNPEPDQILFVYFFCRFSWERFFLCALFSCSEMDWTHFWKKNSLSLIRSKGVNVQSRERSKKIIILAFCLSLTPLSDSLIFGVHPVPESKSNNNTHILTTRTPKNMAYWHTYRQTSNNIRTWEAWSYQVEPWPCAFRLM